MTRAEEYEAKSARNRRDYEKYKERMRAKAKEWYWKNRDYALQKAAANRQRNRECSKTKPRHMEPSIDSIEERLPFALKRDINQFRKAFLKIPILQRPPYDVYLKLKTIEHLRKKQE